MNRIISIMKVLKTRFTDWWTARIERNGCSFSDEHMRRKDAVLEWLFCGNPFGRMVYRRMSANDWTWLRLYYSPIPMVLIIGDRILAACVSFVLIGLTDLFDGWFARRKDQVSAWGEWFETRVDWAYLLQTFIGVFVRYPDMRPFTCFAGLFEVVRAIGGTYLRTEGFEPHPNRSGKWKMPFLVGGIGFRFIHDLVTDVPSLPLPAAYTVLLACYACTTTGIVLSVYSLAMHHRDFRAWRQEQQR